MFRRYISSLEHSLVKRESSVMVVSSLQFLARFAAAGEILLVKVSETEKQLRNLQSKRDVGKDRSGSNDRSETGCNREVNNNSWGASGLVSFGAQNAVAIFCPKTAQILTTLPGHKASVNCTHWLPSSKFAFKGSFFSFFFLFLSYLL
ncbi:unnamed protein product [Brassica oleracea]|uniref:(rape) hypothetical protein n=1 Tax=Brassica napus TaxID=3708 RepID=A0A816U7W3_BRANA|nr:unnamed protein product [Brassica napus]